MMQSLVFSAISQGVDKEAGMTIISNWLRI